MLRLLSSLVVLGAGCLLAVPACDDTRPVAAIHDGTAECEVLGKICHEPGERLGGRYEECHDMGHLNLGKECLKYYDECSELCRAAAGAGGEGGGGHEAGAGGDAHAHEAGAGGAAPESGAGGR